MKNQVNVTLKAQSFYSLVIKTLCVVLVLNTPSKPVFADQFTGHLTGVITFSHKYPGFYGVGVSSAADELELSLATNRARQICESKTKDDSCVNSVYFSTFGNIGSCGAIGRLRSLRDSNETFLWAKTGFSVEKAEKNITSDYEPDSYKYTRIAVYCLSNNKVYQY